jgi:nucleoside-diphosphate-sugar epimerase
MRIALTGATGFVGSHVLAALFAAGHDISVLVRSADTKLNPAAKIIVGDLDNLSALASLVKNADVVLHVAGAITALTQADYFRINFSGTQHVFEAAKSAGVKRLVFVSSLAARLPAISPYAASKRAAEDFLSSVTSGPNILVLRPCAVYGPGDKATLPLLAALQKRVALLPATAASRFSLIHVDDLAGIIVEATKASTTGLLEIDDLSGGHDWAEMAALSFKSGGYPHHITYLPKWLMHLVALGFEGISFLTGRPGMINRAKVRELYTPDWVVKGANWPRLNAIPLSEGLNQTLDWYRKKDLLPPAKRQTTSVQ